LKLKQVWRSYRFLILISGLVVLLDQLSKAYIRSNFQEGVDMWAPWPWMIQYARIIHISNTGIAFGLFQGMGNIFTILYVVVVIGIVYYFMSVPMEDWLLRLALALLLGGALGNLVDRLTQGYVTDFISVGNFPVFNIADSGITLGVIALAIGVWLQERREKLAADALEGDLSVKADPSEALGDGDQVTKDSHLS
jgi:signal peptidase II